MLDERLPGKRHHGHVASERDHLHTERHRVAGAGELLREPPAEPLERLLLIDIVAEVVDDQPAVGIDMGEKIGLRPCLDLPEEFLGGSDLLRGGVEDRHIDRGRAHLEARRFDRHQRRQAGHDRTTDRGTDEVRLVRF